ncbi:MAG: hypothetical protein IPI01_12055 [Ignavibacteriae bacterium]|nr:hypothetical protein [Ignavibacteriota bacterium]
MLTSGIIGQAARGDAYLGRPLIRERILSILTKGSHALLAAPRRVGKSSTLFDLFDNPPAHTIVIYYTSESVNTENEYYEKLFNHVTERLRTLKKYTTLIKDFTSRIDELGLDGTIKLGKRKINYRTEVQSLFESIDLKGERLVVLNDEVSSTVENIREDKDKRAAVHLLQTMRELRQSPHLLQKVQFVYAGSIGIENIVSELNCTNLINDLVSVQIPFSKDEVQTLIERLLSGSSVTLSPEGLERLLSVTGVAYSILYSDPS